MIPYQTLRNRTRRACTLAGALLLAACANQGQPAGQPAAPAPGSAAASQLTLPVAAAWGGEARCAGGDCRVVLVDHRDGEVMVWQLAGRGAELLARHDVAYHPDDAAWLDDTHVVAAVERTRSLDVFALRDGALQPVQQIKLGFAPRRVLLVRPRDGGQAGDHVVELLATPYSGTTVAHVRWNRATGKADVRGADWCATPWHPVPVTQAPGRLPTGWAVGCLDDGRVMWVAQDAAAGQAPVALARFDAVPRQVAPSPSGRWLYVALETGGHNARIDMASGQVQDLPGWPEGAVAALPLADDVIIWGDDQRLHLQHLAADGSVLETRWLETSGFSTRLQLIDLDGDGELDLLVLNSADETSDIIYGPLWQNASTEDPGHSPVPKS